MSAFAKVGLLGLGGAAITGGYFYSKDNFSPVKLQPRKIHEKLFGTVIPLNEVAWENRVKDLNNSINNREVKLVPDLVSLRDDKNEFTREKISTWCYQNLDLNYENDNIRLKNVERFCTYNNKDKLTRVITEGGGITQKWVAANNRLRLENSSLSQKMSDIRSKLLDNQSILGIPIDSDEGVLKQWCEIFYLDTWVENNPDFSDAQKYCSEDGLNFPTRHLVLVSRH